MIALRLEARAARVAVAGVALALPVALACAPAWGAAGAACAFLALRLASGAQLAAALRSALPANEARQALGLGRA